MAPDPVKFTRALWPPGQRGNLSVYAVLDLARDKAIQTLLYQNPGRFCCVESAQLEPAVRDVAPHLLRLRAGSAETSVLLARGWGRSWGIFAVLPSGLAMEEIRRHFHALLRVKDEAGRRHIFRYYDPRVARVFLPTCSSEQLRELFGPVRDYWMEDATGGAFVGFSLDRGALVRRTVSLTGDSHPEEQGRVIGPVDASSDPKAAAQRYGSQP